MPTWAVTGGVFRILVSMNRWYNLGISVMPFLDSQGNPFSSLSTTALTFTRGCLSIRCGPVRLVYWPGRA